MEGVYIFGNGYPSSKESERFRRGNLAYDGFICYFSGRDLKVSKFTACTWAFVKSRAIAFGCEPDNVMVVETPNLWYEKIQKM